MGGVIVMPCNFQDDLALSKGPCQNRDAEILMAMIPRAISVSQSSLAADKNGVDYIVTLTRGAVLYVDAKTRRPGASKYWQESPDGQLVPDIALEKWSVKPSHGKKGKVGWTLCTQKKTDLVLYTFDPSDTPSAFLFSFQLLRMAFHKNLKEWFITYKHAPQDNVSWESEAVFVPVPVVQAAVVMVAEYSPTTTS